MGKLTVKGKHTIKAGNHSYTNMISKPETMRSVQMQEMGIVCNNKRVAT